MTLPIGTRPRKGRAPQGIERASEEQKAVLRRWMRENLSWREIVERAREELDLKTSDTALRGFFERHAWQILGPYVPEGNKPRFIRVVLKIQLTPKFRVLEMEAKALEK